ncbi:MAG: hypothetical protein DWQ19_08755 [Crenarchaeota archaeon]|nr:MAG: hypothetical protein DWQ19_08755 [Thermoproteota archaeon]
MLYKKITNGFVIQTYDTDKPGWVDQEFVAGEEEWKKEGQSDVSEDEDDDWDDCLSESDIPDEILNDYLPFEMVQPSQFLFQEIADGKSLTGLREASNFEVPAGQNVFYVSANEAKGETEFFFICESEEVFLSILNDLEDCPLN